MNMKDTVSSLADFAGKVETEFPAPQTLPARQKHCFSSMHPLRWRSVPFNVSAPLERDRQTGKTTQSRGGLRWNFSEYGRISNNGERFFHIFLSSPVFFIPLHSYPIAEAVACGPARAAMPLGGWGGTHT